MPEINCDPAALARAAACFCYSDKKVEDAIMIYLLAQIAGDTSTPSALAQEAKCFCFADQTMRDAVITYLLCQIANA